MSISVLIADDHEVIHHGISSMLENSGFEIVANATTTAELLKLTRKHKPAIVVLDVRLGQHDGLEAIRRIRSAAGGSRIIVFSAYDNPTYVARAVAAGAHDYLIKSIDREAFVNALHNAIADGPPTRVGVLRGVAGAMANRDVPGDAAVPLTPRETQTLRLVAMGLSNKEIADAMSISVETVKEHVQNMLRKIALNDRTQAAVWAIRHGIA